MTKHGKLDVRLTAHALGIAMRELAQVISCDASSLSRYPTGDRLQPQLRALGNLMQRLRTTFGSTETTRNWLREPNPVLDAQAPIAYLLRGDTVAISRLLTMAETGMPT